MIVKYIRWIHCYQCRHNQLVVNPHPGKRIYFRCLNCGEPVSGRLFNQGANQREATHLCNLR